MLFVMCVATSYGQYNGECWVVSGGDTVYKLHANGNADPTVIPNLAQASAAEVNPTNGVAWIAIRHQMLSTGTIRRPSLQMKHSHKHQILNART